MMTYKEYEAKLLEHSKQWELHQSMTNEEYEAKLLELATLMCQGMFSDNADTSDVNVDISIAGLSHNEQIAQLWKETLESGLA